MTTDTPIDVPDEEITIDNVFQRPKYLEAADKCLTFLNKQLNVNNFNYTIRPAETYDELFRGRFMWGAVDELPQAANVVYPKYIKTDGFYPPNYQGVVSGRWADVARDRKQLAVDVYTITDTFYHSVSCPLQRNGTWQSEVCEKVTEIWGVVLFDEETGEPVLDPTTRHVLYDPASETIKTYYEWIPKIINDRGSNGFKDFRLVEKDWGDIPIDDDAGILIEGPNPVEADLIYQSREELKPTGIMPSESLDVPYAHYKDYIMRLFSLTDAEYLNTEIPLWLTGSVSLGGRNDRRLYRPGDLVSYYDQGDPYLKTPVYLDSEAYGVDSTLFRHAWAYPPVYSDARYDALMHSEFDVGYSDVGWSRGQGPFTPPSTLNPIDPETGEPLGGFFFRIPFQVGAPSLAALLNYSVRFKGGIVVYLNGREIGRHNTPDGGYDHNLATGPPTESAGTHAVSQSVELKGGRCVRGTNVLAIELHGEDLGGAEAYLDILDVSLVDETFPAYTEPFIKSLGVLIGADPESVNFSWLTTSETRGVVRMWSPGNSDVSVTATRATLTGRHGIWTNKAVVSRLVPGNTYQYTISHGSMEVGPFTIEIPRPTSSYSFLVAGDPQLVSNVSATTWNETLERSRVAWPDTHFLISTGDQIDSRTEFDIQRDQYDGFFAPDYMRSMRLAPAIGNHDDLESFKGHYNLPNEDESLGGTIAGGSYWYPYGDTLFMVLNTNSEDYYEQEVFLREALDQYTRKYGTPRWKIVQLHHPLFATTRYSNNVIGHARTEALAPALSALGVDLVITGHEHVYTRTKMMDGLDPVSRGSASSYHKTRSSEVLYITCNSSTGSKYYPIVNGDADFVAEVIQNNRPSIVNVQVSNTSITVSNYATSGMVLLDTFELTKSSAAEEHTPEMTIPKPIVVPPPEKKPKYMYGRVPVEPGPGDPDEEEPLPNPNPLEGATSFFFTPHVFEGKKIIRVLDNSAPPPMTVAIVNATTNIQAGRLPASFMIPEDDPQYDREGNTAMGIFGYMLNSRCWVYDAGLALLVYATAKDYEKCKEILDRLLYEQNEDGSWNFSFDLYIGQLFEPYVRVGSIGWVVWGACFYALESGDTTYNEMLEKAGEFLLGKQVSDPDDPRYGLLLGGYGSYNMDDYEHIDIEIQWCSTEHNCSALQALLGLSLVLGDPRYSNSLRLVKASLLNTLYDFEENRFYQGVNLEGIDTAWALDCTTWAGKLALGIVNELIPSRCLTTAREAYKISGVAIEQSTETLRYNTRYSSPHLFTGYKPYSDRTDDYEGAPELVWSEGTLGAAALALAIGDLEEAIQCMDEMVALQNVKGSSGGILYTTSTYGELPWEFHAWESVVAAAWFYLVVHNPNALFPLSLKALDTFHASWEAEPLGPGFIDRIQDQPEE